MKVKTEKAIANGRPESLPFEGIIFDMDGTLVMSTEADFLAWKKLFGDYNELLTFEKYAPLLGVRSADLVRTMLGLQDEALTEALRKKMSYFREVIDQQGIQSVPFAHDLLQQLKAHPVKLALATSSRREKMKLIMEKTGLLHFFDAVVTGEEVHNGKPAPDIFIKAAARLDIPVTGCVVIEDAVSGVTAAKKAGMKCIAITTTHSAGQLQEADMVISSYESFDIEKLADLR